MAAPARAGFKCVEALGRIIIRGPYPLSNAIIYMHVYMYRYLYLLLHFVKHINLNTKNEFINFYI